MAAPADRFAMLDGSADPAVVAVLRSQVASAADRDLCRVNALAFAARHGLDEEKTIAALLHAVALGIFDISWNILCPGCGGVLESSASLKSVVKTEYECALCARGYEATLDELVEVTFTVHPQVRRIAAHAPEQMPIPEYLRQIYWGSGVDIPEGEYEQILESVLLESVEVEADEKIVLSLQLPEKFIIVFEAVTHAVQFIDVKGEPTREKQALSLIYDRTHSINQTLDMRPGPLRIAIENKTGARVLPLVFIADHELHDFLARRRPFLTATRLLTNQTFRDLYRTDTLSVEQRLKITSLTFLFTDLRGSTELYERVGDLVAFDIVSEHFHALHAIVASEAGAVVKTIGDAVMATFPTPDRALAAALRMREKMTELNRLSGREDLLLKIGMHEGSCIAVSMNERQDYFGQTVNIASRVQGMADTQAIFATGAIVNDRRSADLLKARSLVPVAQQASLKGLEREMTLYAIS